MKNLLIKIAVTLITLWLLGIVTSYAVVGVLLTSYTVAVFIELLLAIALIAMLIRLI